MGQVMLNGRISNDKPEDVIRMNGDRLVFSPPSINGFASYDISLNGLDVPQVIPNCVLYLPARHPIMGAASGGSVKNLAGANESLANTGVVWTPKGWVFAGDDYYKYTGANWRSGDSQGAIGLFFKTAAIDAAQILFNSSDEAVTTAYLSLYIHANGSLHAAQRNNDTADDKSFGGNYLDNKWHSAFMLSDGSAYSMVADGVSIGTAGGGGDWFADTDGRDNFTIGCRKDTALRFPFYGQIGLVLAHSVPLSVAQIAALHNSLKWRFR